jgi:hypothetical protein
VVRMRRAGAGPVLAIDGPAHSSQQQPRAQTSAEGQEGHASGCDQLTDPLRPTGRRCGGCSCDDGGARVIGMADLCMETANPPVGPLTLTGVPNGSSVSIDSDETPEPVLAISPLLPRPLIRRGAGASAAVELGASALAFTPPPLPPATPRRALLCTGDPLRGEPVDRPPFNGARADALRPASDGGGLSVSLAYGAPLSLVSSAAPASPPPSFSLSLSLSPPLLPLSPGFFLPGQHFSRILTKIMCTTRIIHAAPLHSAHRRPGGGEGRAQVTWRVMQAATRAGDRRQTYPMTEKSENQSKATYCCEMDTCNDE